jgi:phosphoribosyl 1,2-cyclic phosphodiesterase
MMKLSVIGTGSKGNCYVLENMGKYIVLDAGCKFKSVMAATGYNTLDIDGCIVTHKHTDHAKYCGHFIKHGIPVVSNKETIDFIGGGKLAIVMSEKKWFKIGAFEVLPFFVPHDGVENYAYIIKSGGESLFYATDYEYIKYNLSTFKINHFLIECNHSEDVSEESANYGHVYLGHASLEATERFITASKSESLRNIILCHLSAVNADYERILATVRNAVSDETKVDIASNGKEYIL